MAKFIPVEPEKWAEMVKAAASSDYWRIEAETDHARWLRTLEENEKLRAEVERLRKAGDWQPIETAPKDGTWVLLWWKETPTGAECFDEWSPEQAVGKWHYDCWMRCSEYCVGGTPTAWQSLPNPPAKEGKQS